MNVSLTPQLEQMIMKKVASGRYSSASEVVREALRLFEDHEYIRKMRLEELRREVQTGVDQLDQGQATEFDESALGRIKARGRELLESNREKKSS